jgi:Fis family transcriptional regulator, factor for inversion stimulation protein
VNQINNHNQINKKNVHDFSFRDAVAKNMKEFFSRFEPGSHPPREIYVDVLAEVERPLLEAVLLFTRGNQSEASKILGINRGTLRKKLVQYRMISR